jgi:hypothetical protein
MKNTYNSINENEKKRILEMHKKGGYKTIISEAPMDSMFYPGDDYVKDSGKVFENLLSEIKDFFSNLSEDFIKEIPNPEKLIMNASNFFGKDVTKMNYDEIKMSLENKFSSKNLDEGFWSDYFKYDNRKDADSFSTPLKDVKGGIEQKIGFILQKIFGVNVMSFGLIGSFLLSKIAEINISPILGMLVSLVAVIVIGLVRGLMKFTRERYKI